MLGDPQTPTPASQPRQSVLFAAVDEQDDVNYEKYASPTGPRYYKPWEDPYSRTRTELSGVSRLKPRSVCRDTR